MSLFLTKEHLVQWMFGIGGGLAGAALLLGVGRLRGVRLPAAVQPLADFSATLLLRQWRLAVIGSFFYGAGLLWYRHSPLNVLPRALEYAIVEEQLQRSKTIAHADILVVGDSSGLMGVDAPLLGRLLGGKKVENLCTLGYVGPAGYASLLERYFQRGLKAETVILLMHGVSLNRPEKEWEGWQDMVVDERDFRGGAENSWKGVRAKLNEVAFGRLFTLPMPGAWGGFYGTSFEVRDAIRTHAGSLYEPVWRLPLQPEAVKASISAGFVHHTQLSKSAEERLTIFADKAVAFPVDRIVFGFTPTYLSLKSAPSLAEVKQTVAQVEGLLRAKIRHFDRLELEPFEADGYFATETHLNRVGREHFTHELATLLRAGAPAPAPVDGN